MQKIPKFYKWRHIPSGLFWISQRYNEVDQDPAFQPAMNRPYVLTNLDQNGKIFTSKRKIEKLVINHWGYIDSHGNQLPTHQRPTPSDRYVQLPPMYYSHLSGWHWLWDTAGVTYWDRRATPGYIIEQVQLPFVRSDWELVEFQLTEIGIV